MKGCIPSSTLIMTHADIVFWQLVHTAVVGSMGGMFFPGVSGMMLNSMTAALYFYARISGVQEKLVKQYWG